MTIHRRQFIALLAGTGTLAAAAPVRAQLISTLGADATHLGIHPGSPDDQSAALQQALDRLAATRAPLALPPGTYRAANLRIQSGTQIVGIRGSTRLVLSSEQPLISGTGCDHVTLADLVMDGGKRPLGDRGMIQIEQGRSLRIADCEIAAAGGTAIKLTGVDGEITGNAISESGAAALLSLDARGLRVTGNTIRDAGDNGILIWRSQPGDDGSIVSDNRIDAITNRSGGSGQYGNAINVFRASNVIVRGNRVRNCAFTAVRGNHADGITIDGNSITGMGEVAIYSEFGFQGAIVSGNAIDGAALGVAITNFNEGGQLAVVSGNLVRNLKDRRPAGTDPNDSAGVGISAEADTAVTGNVIENAPRVGIALGWGNYLRDVTATGNVVRRTEIGIAVSVAQGAGSAVIADNLISGASRGAILGMRFREPVADLLKPGAERYAQIAVSGNRVS